MTALDLEIDKRVKKMDVTNLTCELDTPSFKSFFCKRETEAITYSFRIIFSPSLVVISGDCGELILTPNTENTLKWLCNCAHSINSITRQIRPEFQNIGKLYDPKKAIAIIKEMMESQRELYEECHSMTQEELEDFEWECNDFIEKCYDFNNVDEFHKEFEEFLAEVDENGDFDLGVIDVTKYDDFALNRFAQLRAFSQLYQKIN